MTVLAKRRTRPPDYEFPSVTGYKDNISSIMQLLHCLFKLNILVLVAGPSGGAV